MIYAIQNAIPPELLQQIKSNITDELIASKTKPFGRHYRVGSTVNISKNENLVSLDADICKFVKKLSEEFVEVRYKPPFSGGDSGYEFHRYMPGEMCLTHGDGECIFNEDNTSLLRYATVIMHLNTVKNGGETVFPNQNKSFSTVEGQVLIFPPYAGYQHYVTPSEEVRDIVMTWLVYSNITVVKRPT